MLVGYLTSRQTTGFVRMSRGRVPPTYSSAPGSILMGRLDPRHRDAANHLAEKSFYRERSDLVLVDKAKPKAGERGSRRGNTRH